MMILLVIRLKLTGKLIMNNIINMQDDNIDLLTIDTHIIIWYLEGIKLTEAQINIIDKARSEKNLYISAISVWEIAMLASKGRIALSIELNEWIGKLLTLPGINLINLTPSVLIESTKLPSYQHNDPADRMIIASVRSINSHLMTHDQNLISYGQQGYIKIVS